MRSTSGQIERGRSPTNPTEVLLSRSRKGDRSALTTLLRRYQTRVLGVVRRRLGTRLRSHVESRDVAQDVLIEALSDLDKFEVRGERAFLRWLAGITENRLRNLARSEGRRVDVPDGNDIDRNLPDPVRPDEVEAAKHQQQLLDAGLQRVTPLHRRVIQLRHYEQLSFRQIGRALGRTEDAAWMLHKRAKAELISVIHGLRQQETV